MTYLEIGAENFGDLPRSLIDTQSDLHCHLKNPEFKIDCFINSKVKSL